MGVASIGAVIARWPLEPVSYRGRLPGVHPASIPCSAIAQQILTNKLSKYSYFGVLFFHKTPITEYNLNLIFIYISQITDNHYYYRI